MAYNDKVGRDDLVEEYRKRRAERIGASRYDAVEEFRKRRARRLLSHMDDEESNEKGSKGHGNTRIPYGLCQRENITIGKDWSPSDAWDALAGKGIKASDVYAGLKESKSTASIKKGPTKHLSRAECSSATRVGGYRRKHIGQFKNGYGMTSSRARDGMYAESMRKHTDANGQWTEEREALHSQIIDSMFEGVKKPEGKPLTVFMGGGPACGKSYVVKHEGEKLGVPEGLDRVKVDADECKEKLPEYDPKKPEIVHEESSALARRIVKLSQENGYNTVVDGTGDGSVGRMLDKIRQAREAGHTVNGVYVFTDVDNAIYQNFKRDRSVLTDIVVSTHMAIPEILPRIASEFDDVKLYANMMDGNPPVLVAEGGNGSGLRVVNQEYYKKFMDIRKYRIDYRKIRQIKERAMADLEKEGKRGV